MHSVGVKLGWAARVLSSPEIWRIVVKEGGRRKKENLPTITLMEEDRETKLSCYRIEEHSYWLPSSMDWSMLGELYAEVFNENHSHHYEYQGCRVSPEDVILDAGASEGFFTRFALDRGAKVIAVEPWEPMARALSRTFQTEIAEGRVEVVQASLGASIGESILQYDSARPWAARIVPGKTSVTNDLVATTTIDSLVKQSKWGRCDFIKMDIEGSEQEAIRGATETLQKDQPQVSIAVYHHPTGYLDLRNTLKRLRLDYQISGKGLMVRKGIPRPMMLHAWSTGPSRTEQ